MVRTLLLPALSARVDVSRVAVVVVMLALLALNDAKLVLLGVTGVLASVWLS